MELPQFKAKTHMERADYRKFLYIATFFRDPVTLPLIILMAGVGAYLGAWRGGRLEPVYFAALWLTVTVLAVGVICLRVEQKNRRREKAAARTGALDRHMEFSFFSGSLCLNNPARESSSTLEYGRFYRLLETKDYYIFYLTANQVALLCKRDVENPEDLSDFLRVRFGKKYRSVKL